MTTTKIIVGICSNYDTTDDYDGWSLMMMMMMTMMMIMMMMMKEKDNDDRRGESQRPD